jgi:hypothetical protein
LFCETSARANAQAVSDADKGQESAAQPRRAGSRARSAISVPGC